MKKLLKFVGIGFAIVLSLFALYVVWFNIQLDAGHYSNVRSQNEQLTLPTPTDIVIPPLDAVVITSLVNQWKISQGESAYQQSEFLCDIAEVRIEEVKEDWSHDKFYAGRFCTNSCTIGENLAEGYRSEEQTLNAWLNSPSHKAELAKSYTHACIVTDGSYAVQIFGYY